MNRPPGPRGADAVRDDVCGTPVPAGSMVAVLPYLIHRNPAVWPNPAGFDPGRFLPGAPQRHRYALDAEATRWASRNRGRPFTILGLTSRSLLRPWATPRKGQGSYQEVGQH
jgi:hypothetical protein